MKIKILLVFALAFVIASCDDNTGNLGISSDIDKVSNTTSNFPVYTRSVLMDQGIIANNSNCYLGSVIDPETGCEIDADFAAQFQTFENYGFPKKELMVDASDTNHVVYGKPLCDSCDVRLFFDSYYGDGNNPMKLQAYEMSANPEKMMREDATYYTDIDLTQFLDEDAKPIASRLFTATDYDVSQDERESSSYIKSIHMMLPASFGQRIMDKFYEDSKNFQDSYNFIHNVMPGLYFRCSNGTGTMIKVYVGTLNIYFNYKDAKKDSIYSAMARFAATPEVIQSTRFKNSENMKQLVNVSDYTLLKTPAGIATEMTLPIDEIFGGEHAIDSVSKASITLTRYNKVQSTNQLKTPAELLMVRKVDMENFFKNRMVTNNRTNYTTTFSTTYNTYTFGNISRLLSYCKHEKIDAVRKRLEAKGYSQFTQAQFDAEEKLWMSENPDWNKVLLIPVVTSTTTLADNTVVQVSVNHDMSLNSIRLVGGATPLQIQVVYSRFEQ